MSMPSLLQLALLVAVSSVMGAYMVEGRVKFMHYRMCSPGGLISRDTSLPKSVRLVSGERALSKYRSKARPHVSTNPIFESTRFELNTKLRNRLHRLVRQEGIDSRRGWVRCFERFQLNSLIIGETEADVLLPSGCARSTALLEKDLLLLEGMTAEKARSIASTFSDDTQKATRAIKARFSSQLLLHMNWGEVEMLKNAHNDHVSLRLKGDVGAGVDVKKVAYLQQDHRIVTISGAHLRKLRSLWEANNISDATSEQGFRADLFSILTRYQALEGKGWQAGTPDAVQACLQRHFGVFAEAFASPLNCYHPLYFSAFPDTDGAFGSCGSFFEFIEGEASSTTGGSYVANPPFCQYAMLRAIEGIRGCLDRAKRNAHERGKQEPPLSFVVIVPAWGEGRDISVIEGDDGEDKAFATLLKNEAGADLHYPALMAHPYRTGHVLVPAEEHCYLDGFQHQLTPPKVVSAEENKDEGSGEVKPAGEGGRLSWAQAKMAGGNTDSSRFYRCAPFDTAVFFLQNEAGAKKWPLTAYKERKLRETWKAHTLHLHNQGEKPAKYTPRRYSGQSATPREEDEMAL